MLIPDTTKWWIRISFWRFSLTRTSDSFSLASAFATNTALASGWCWPAMRMLEVASEFCQVGDGMHRSFHLRCEPIRLRGSPGTENPGQSSKHCPNPAKLQRSAARWIGQLSHQAAGRSPPHRAYLSGGLSSAIFSSVGRQPTALCFDAP